MPLRKDSRSKALLAGAGLVAALAMTPSAASAASWTSWVPSKTVKTAPAPTPTTSTTPPPTTTTSTPPASTATSSSTPAPAPAPAPTVSGADTSGCVEQPTVKAYSRFGDDADYAPAPGATFEQGQAGWTFSKKAFPWDEGKVASIVKGNDGNNIVAGANALQLTQDSYAISPKFCVDESHPHFRFSFKVTGWASKFDVLITYRDLAGTLTEAQFVSSSSMQIFPGNWQISPASPLATNIPLVSGGKAASVQVYAKVANGTVQFDNFMVDPYRRR
ncbi:MAG: hypothetical protein ACEQSX_00710 [Baekduiaceae bacterium]